MANWLKTRRAELEALSLIHISRCRLADKPLAVILAFFFAPCSAEPWGLPPLDSVRIEDFIRGG